MLWRRVVLPCTPPIPLHPGNPRKVVLMLGETVEGLFEGAGLGHVSCWAGPPVQAAGRAPPRQALLEHGSWGLKCWGWPHFFALKAAFPDMRCGPQHGAMTGRRGASTSDCYPCTLVLCEFCLTAQHLLWGGGAISCVSWV